MKPSKLANTGPRPPRASKKKEKHQEGAFDRVRSILGEHFDRVVIMVEVEGGGMEWFTNSSTWAQGACTRLIRRFDENEREYIRGRD